MSLVQDGRIVKSAPEIKEEGAEMIDARSSRCSWLVDIHVHSVNLVKLIKKHIHTGALAAAAGGFTTVVMMAILANHFRRDFARSSPVSYQRED